MSDGTLDQILDAWLDLGPNVAPDRLHAAVAKEVRMTPQAGAWRRWASQAFTSTNTFAGIGMGVVAGILVAILGMNLLQQAGGRVGGDAWSPSPSFTPRPTPATTRAQVDRHAGDYLIGRASLTVDGIPLSFNVPARGWEPFGDLLISKSTFGPQGAEAVIFWTTFPDGVHADPCATWSEPAGASAADLAAGLSTAPGVELVTGPSDVTIGGLAATHLVLIVRDDVGCDPGFFYNWKAQTGGAMWETTDVGDTIRIWIVEVNGTRLFIEAETHADAGDRVEAEIQHIVESISFD